MKSPLYKKFQHLKTALADGDFRSAEVLLQQLHKENLSSAAQVLFDSFNRKFSLASGVVIEFESQVTMPQIEPERPDGMLSSYDRRPLLDGISLVSCCMNRNDNLKKSLTSWLKLPVQEIVIVDWSSSNPVAKTISDIADERVKVVRVENETRWILTYAFNVGLRFASYNKIFKLDADIEKGWRLKFHLHNHYEGPSNEYLGILAPSLPDAQYFKMLRDEYQIEKALITNAFHTVAIDAGDLDKFRSH